MAISLSRALIGTLREPLFHFLVIGLLIFTAEVIWSPEDRSNTIVVDRQTIDAIVARQEALQTRPVDKKQRAQLIESYIESEVLVREARRRGLVSDGYIRAHLERKMRYILDDRVPSEPTEQDLRAFFLATKHRYTAAPSISFDHVFFQSVTRESRSLLEKLRGGMPFQDLGDDFFVYENRIDNISELELAKVTDIEFVRTLTQSPVGEWRGPVKSPSGLHFIRLQALGKPIEPTFESMRGYIFSVWVLHQHRQRVSSKIEELKKNYRIDVNAEGRG